MSMEFAAIERSNQINNVKGAIMVVCDDLDEANNECQGAWNDLTNSEKIQWNAHYFVAKVDEDELQNLSDWSDFESLEIGLDCFDSNKVNEIEVEYDAGPSRWCSGYCLVDYMFAEFENESGETVQLYAELDNPFDDDCGSYLSLKSELEYQAKVNGLHPSRLHFVEPADFREYSDDYRFLRVNRRLYEEMQRQADSKGLGLLEWLEKIVD